MNQQLMKDIITAYGPSGREQAVSDVIRAYVAPYADEVWNDTLGNLIALKRGTSGKKLMLSAHMDQIGLIVTDIDEHGFLRASNVGGLSAQTAIARQVVFANGTRGVTYYENKEKTASTATLNELFIDIGASNREEAEAKAAIGDMAVFASGFTLLGSRVSCGALDNRICCAILAQAMEQMHSSHDIYAVFTVQEELGLRGAGAAAYAIEPDMAVNLDVTGIGDTPECARMSCALGKGPTIKVMDGSLIVSPAVRAFMTGCAQRANIPYQNEVLKHGGTDTAAIQRTRCGIPAGCISIPTRYIHTPVETADLSDCDNAVKLLLAISENENLA